jgi:hypothetical protein
VHRERSDWSVVWQPARSLCPPGSAPIALGVNDKSSRAIAGGQFGEGLAKGQGRSPIILRVQVPYLHPALRPGALELHAGLIAVREDHACGFKHGTDLGQLFRARRLPGIRSLSLADRVPSNAATTDSNLSAVPAEQLPSLPDLITSNHR